MSPLWQWFFAIIGLVAFIMAFPFVLQLIFGQPKIGLVFNHDDTGEEGRLIKVNLMNPPINNSLLKILRVTRLPAQDVYLMIKVQDTTTEQFIDSFIPEITLSHSGNKSGRVSLPPSILMANVKIAKWQRSTNSAVLYGAKNQIIPLQEGVYKVFIRIGLDGNTKYCKPCLLHIGKTETEMIWDEEITNKFLM